MAKKNLDIVSKNLRDLKRIVDYIKTKPPKSTGGTFEGTLDEVPDGATYKRTTQTEKDSWNGKAAGNHNHAGVYEPAFIKKVKLAGNIVTGANVTTVTVTGLIFDFEANSDYLIEIFGEITAAAATTGCGLQFDTSVAVTNVDLTFFHQLANTGTLSGGNSIADNASQGVSSGIPGANGTYPIYAAGKLNSGANAGTAQLMFRSETTAATTLKANTIMRVMKL